MVAPAPISAWSRSPDWPQRPTRNRACLPHPQDRRILHPQRPDRLHRRPTSELHHSGGRYATALEGCGNLNLIQTIHGAAASLALS